MAMRVPQLIGHRGYPQHHPENTLCGLEAAAAAGACWLEIDVQLSRDAVPVVIHDTDLRRTAGVAGSVLDMDYRQLRDVVVDERARLGSVRSAARLPRLAETAEWLGGRPDLTLFVELKPQSLRRHGAVAMLRRVMQDLTPVRERVVLISFRAGAVRAARRAGAACGWVTARWDAAALQRADALAPDFLFCDHRIVPDKTDLPAGPWRWALYDIVDPEAALAWSRRGAALIETWAIGEMLTHPALAGAACGR